MTFSAPANSLAMFSSVSNVAPSLGCLASSCGASNSILGYSSEFRRLTFVSATVAYARSISFAMSDRLSGPMKISIYVERGGDNHI